MSQKLHIGTIIQNARVFNIQHWRDKGMPMNDILSNVITLFTLLNQRKVSFVLAGDLIMLQHVQGRNTEDIDLIVALSSLKEIPEITITEKDVYFARGDYQGLQIDFLLTKNPLFARIKKAYTIEQTFLEQRMTCVTVDGLVLMKLYALPSLYCQGNFARVGLYENDIATLLFYHQPNLAQIEQELQKYLSASDFEAVQKILADLRSRIQRFNQTNHSDIN